MDDVIRKDSEEFKQLLGRIKIARAGVRTVTENYRPILNGEYYLSGHEVMEFLHVSPRTLQTLRDTRTIGFTIVMGKILYPERELNRVLTENYRPPCKDLLP